MTVTVPPKGTRGVPFPRRLAALGNGFMVRMFRRRGVKTGGGIDTLLLETPRGEVRQGSPRGPRVPPRGRGHVAGHRVTRRRGAAAGLAPQPRQPSRRHRRVQGRRAGARHGGDARWRGPGRGVVPHRAGCPGVRGLPHRRPIARSPSCASRSADRLRLPAYLPVRGTRPGDAARSCRSYARRTARRVRSPSRVFVSGVGQATSRRRPVSTS